MGAEKDLFSTLDSGGHPRIALEVQNFAAVAWSLWLASRAHSSMGKTVQLPMLDVFVYLFRELNERMSFNGVRDPNYRNSESESLLGILWTKLSGYGIEKALHESTPLHSRNGTFQHIIEEDQKTIFDLVRLLFLMQDNHKNAGFYVPATVGCWPAMAGGGIRKAIHILSGTNSRFPKRVLKKTWDLYKPLAHLLYSCQAAKVSINSLSTCRFESIDPVINPNLGRLLKTISSSSVRLRNVEPPGSSKKNAVMDLFLFEPRRCVFYRNTLLKNVAFNGEEIPYSPMSPEETIFSSDYNSAEQW